MSDTQPEFRFDQLEDVTGGDPVFEIELLGEYLKSTPVELDSLRAGIAAGDSARICAAAHTIKGSSGTIGCVALPEVAAELEKMGRMGELEGASETFARLEMQYASVKQLLEERMQSRAA